MQHFFTEVPAPVQTFYICIISLALPATAVLEARMFLDFSKAKVTEQNSIRAMGRTILVGAGPLMLLLLMVLLVQLHGIYQYYQFYVTTAGEGHCIYGIWKVQEGHPLYAWPNKDFFQLTLYNFGFYHLYAGVLNLLHVRGPQIMWYGRLLTAVLAFGGCLIQIRLLSLLAAGVKSRAVHGAIFLICFYTWFNSYFTGRFTITVRPDMAAVAMSTLALYFFIRYVMTCEMKWVYAAGAAWAATWCIKQADISCIFGAGVYLLACRKWKATAVLSVMFIIPVGLALLLGTAEYRWNILVAPTVNGLDYPSAVRAFFDGIRASRFSWFFVAALPLYLYLELRNASKPAWVALREQSRPGNVFAPVVALAVIVFCGLAPSLTALAKKGSGLNQMFEVFVAASTLSFILVLRLAAVLPDRSSRWFRVLVCLLLLSMCSLPIRQLRQNQFGPMASVTDSNIAQKENFSLFLKSLKKPLFIDDEVYSLPWHAQYPAMIIDHVFYDDAVARGISPGMGDLIKKHWFATLYIPTNTPLYGEALAAQYRTVPIASAQTHYLDSIFNREREPCVLLKAP